jgi:hypothetical protein
MALEGPPEPQPERSLERRTFDSIAAGVVFRSLDKAKGQLAAKLSEKMQDAFKMGRSQGRRQGAAIAFGLIGMAEAIRASQRHGEDK